MPAEWFQNGLIGGVTHLFFCTSFIIKGDSLIGTFGGNDLPSSLVTTSWKINPADPEKTFYHDCDAGQIEASIAALEPHSYQTLHSPCTYAAWKDIPSTYLYCTQDAAIPLVVQQGMVEGTANGTGMRTESVNASHSPFLGKPDEVTAAIRRAAGEVV